jgi:hypothetical protein
MAHEKVCSWLKLPTDRWPPDHYTLLGLPPGESDVARIEHQVHERLMRLRCYQLHHPEVATEAMNLLARAFTCLTDPTAKKAYDARLLGLPADETEPAVTTAEPLPEAADPSSGDPLAWLFGSWHPPATQESPSAANQQTLVDWTTSPPPLRIPASSSTETVPPPAPTLNGVPPAGEGPPAETTAAALSPASEPVDPILELAQSSLGRRGLVTTRDLFQRIVRTRQLIAVWEQAGRYLNQPGRRVLRPAEAAFLTRRLTTILHLLRGFPAVMGEAGQPGSYVVALARQQAIVPTFRALQPSQRETLARDWRAGNKSLLAYRRVLRLELRARRQLTCLGRWRWAVHAAFSDYPFFMVLAVVALVAALALFGVFLDQLLNYLHTRS